MLVGTSRHTIDRVVGAHGTVGTGLHTIFKRRDVVGSPLSFGQESIEGTTADRVVLRT